MISAFSFLAFIAKCLFKAIMPYICYMELPPFGSPILSSFRRLTMAQLVLSSPDPNLAASSDSVTTIFQASSFSSRISEAVYLVHAAQMPAPITNLITLTDACVSRIEANYRPDISEDMLIALISSILSLRESEILDAPLRPSLINNNIFPLPDLESEEIFDSPGTSAPENFQHQQASAGEVV